MNIQIKKLSLDNVMLVLWISYLMINSISHYINEWFGGLINMLVIWLFLFYFAFVYKRKSTSNKRIDITNNKGVILLFIIFAIWYVFEYQFFYHSTSVYTSFGVVFSNIAWNMFSFFPHVLSAIFILFRSDKDNYSVIKKSLIVMSAIVFIASMFVLIVNPNAAKLTATGKTEYYPFFFDFSIISSFAVIAPVLLNSAIHDKHRVFRYLYLILIFYGIFKSAFFIALTTMMLGIFLYFIFSIKRKTMRSILVILLAVVAFTIIGSGMYENIVNSIVGKLNNYELEKRISQLLIYTETGVTEDTTSRILLYTRSLTQIWNHPITGNILWDSNCFISGHSTILDIWNGCGILFLILLGVIGNKLFRINSNKTTNKHEKSALFASTLALLFTATFNPIIASPFIVILWILAPSTFRKDNKREITYDNC